MVLTFVVFVTSPCELILDSKHTEVDMHTMWRNAKQLENYRGPDHTNAFFKLSVFLSKKTKENKFRPRERLVFTVVFSCPINSFAYANTYFLISFSTIDHTKTNYMTPLSPPFSKAFVFTLWNAVSCVIAPPVVFQSLVPVIETCYQ